MLNVKKITDNTSINRAEIAAVKISLRWIIENAEKIDNLMSNKNGIVLYSDSLATINNFN